MKIKSLFVVTIVVSMIVSCSKNETSLSEKTKAESKTLVVTNRTTCPPCDACLAARNSCYTAAESNFFNNIATMGATGTFNEGWQNWSNEKIYSAVDPNLQIGEVWTLGESKVVKRGPAGPNGTYYTIGQSGYNNALQILQQSKELCDQAYNNCLP